MLYFELLNNYVSVGSVFIAKSDHLTYYEKNFNYKRYQNKIITMVTVRMKNSNLISHPFSCHTEHMVSVYHLNYI